MKKSFILATLPLLLLSACGNSKKSGNAYPANFDRIGDSGRIDYMIRTVPADSVARFIIYTALGRNPGARIDTMATATNHAYEILKGDSLDSFASAYDSTVEALPLGDKMKIYMLAGSEDPQGLGYRLGLEYMSSIREGNKKAADVDAEINEFRKACGQDTAMYRRFMIGFQTVLKVDHGKDVPEDIYRKYVSTQE